jgi:hypothetical protein
MVHRILVSCAWVCCSLIVASFWLFAIDQISGASKQQVAEIAGGSPTRASTPIVHTHHGQPRSFIDGAAETLTYPFHSLVSSDSQWGYHLFILVSGVLVYGLGLGYLGRYATGLR